VSAISQSSALYFVSAAAFDKQPVKVRVSASLSGESIALEPLKSGIRRRYSATIVLHEVLPLLDSEKHKEMHSSVFADFVSSSLSNHTGNTRQNWSSSRALLAFRD